MDVYYCDHFTVPLPEHHRFPMGKYAALRRALVARGVVSESELHPAEPVSRTDVERVHAAEYVRAFVSGELPSAAMQRIGFPWSPSLVQRCLASAGGTLAAARAALRDGTSGTLAGGTHHAHRDWGSGYCVFNDIAIAAAALLEEGRAARVLVFDADVHQGDGTAAIFSADDRVFTCSVHGENNFPRVKERSDLDVPLPDGTPDDVYLLAIERALDHSLRRSTPDVVFFQAGVDALAEDRLGRLAVTSDGLLRRDELVLRRLRALDLPVVLTLGGGYAQPIEASVDAHVQTYRVATARPSSRRAGRDTSGRQA